MGVGIEDGAGREIQVLSLIWRANVVPRLAIGLDSLALADPDVAISYSDWTRHREACGGLVVA